ncbi:unnamed protein product [Rodentolepis nana]|uniref:Transposase n=1 Tax=Rodentolepis nana TaxID=102285 RepID=A0A0R3TQT1_RODNA|nr:unnamed protein product [Rodentolepis nana]
MPPAGRRNSLKVGRVVFPDVRLVATSVRAIHWMSQRASKTVKPAFEDTRVAFIDLVDNLCRIRPHPSLATGQNK